MTTQTSSPRQTERGPADIQIGPYLHQERYLHTFFYKLKCAGIITLADLYNYTAEELFEIAPTSKKNQERFLSYAKSGAITLAPK